MYVKSIITAVLLLSICYATTNLHSVSTHDIQPYNSTNNTYKNKEKLKATLSKTKTKKICGFFKAFNNQSKCFDEISLKLAFGENQFDMAQNASDKLNFEYPDFNEKPILDGQNRFISKNETVEIYSGSIRKDLYSANKNVIDSDLFDSDGNVNNHLIITENRPIQKRETEDYYDFNKTSSNESELVTNETESREDYLRRLKDFIFPKAWGWVLIFFHTAVFVIGLVGNTLVCVAVYRNHTMRTVTNYFIVNLALADFLVILLCLPPSVIWDVTSTWFLGVALCKIVLYLQFHQSDYHIIHHRLEMKNYNRSYVQIGKASFDPLTRTTRALSLDIDLLFDVKRPFPFTVQVYRFASNEYRLFPAFMKLDYCKLMDENIFGLQDITIHSNLTGCPVKKGRYIIRKYRPDESKFPPFLVPGDYKAVLIFLCGSNAVAEAHWFGSIKKIENLWN